MPNNVPIRAVNTFNAAITDLIDAESDYLTDYCGVPEELRWGSESDIEIETPEDFAMAKFTCWEEPEFARRRQRVLLCRNEIRGSARDLRNIIAETASSEFLATSGTNSVVGRILDLVTQLQMPAQMRFAAEDVPREDPRNGGRTYGDMEGSWTPVARTAQLLFDATCQRIEDAIEELSFAVAPSLHDGSFQVAGELPSVAENVEPNSSTAIAEAEPVKQKKKPEWVADPDATPPKHFDFNGKATQPVIFKTQTEMGFALHPDDTRTPEAYQQYLRTQNKSGNVWIRWASPPSTGKFEAFLRPTSDFIKRVEKCRDRILMHREQQKSKQKAKPNKGKRSATK
jgi:hypothetical protein